MDTTEGRLMVGRHTSARTVIIARVIIYDIVAHRGVRSWAALLSAKLSQRSWSKVFAMVSASIERQGSKKEKTEPNKGNVLLRSC